MKSAFGGVGLFMIVIFFIVLFTGYICMSINHTRAFNVKNAVIRIIERHGTGTKNIDKLASDITDDVVAELNEIGYRIESTCKEGWYGFEKNNRFVEESSKALFCIKKIETTNATLNKSMHYYQVETFYQLDIPIVKTLMRLTIKGDTIPML